MCERFAARPYLGAVCEGVHQDVDFPEVVCHLLCTLLWERDQKGSLSLIPYAAQAAELIIQHLWTPQWHL